MVTYIYSASGTDSTPRPRSGDWLRDAGVHVGVSLLTRQEVEELELAGEPDLCARNGIEFLSFPIDGRGVPVEDSGTSRFISEQ